MKKTINERLYPSPFTLHPERGQTLVLLLVYVLIAMIVITSAVTISIVNSQGSDKVYQGTSALAVAESGGETAILKLLRDPEYGGEILTVNGGTATISIEPPGSTIKTVTSVGTLGNFTRTIQATVDLGNNVLTVTSWEEQ